LEQLAKASAMMLTDECYANHVGSPGGAKRHSGYDNDPVPHFHKFLAHRKFSSTEHHIVDIASVFRVEGVYAPYQCQTSGSLHTGREREDRRIWSFAGEAKGSCPRGGPRSHSLQSQRVCHLVRAGCNSIRSGSLWLVAM